MTDGYFITFEGGEGTGKSTQIRLLAEYLETRHHTVVVTREPGGTPVAEAARAVILDPALDPDGLTELFLLEAARRDHVERVVRPALERGKVVLSDRYADSSTVYQGMVRGLGEELVIQLNRLATNDLEPDLTIVFDLDPEAGLHRARSRNAEGDGAESRLDDEPNEFHQQVREGFLRLAELHPHRVRVIDAGGEPDDVFARLLQALPENLQ
jgi:dTMP kinase